MVKSAHHSFDGFSPPADKRQILQEKAPVNSPENVAKWLKRGPLKFTEQYKHSTTSFQITTQNCLKQRLLR